MSCLVPEIMHCRWENLEKEVSVGNFLSLGVAAHTCDPRKKREERDVVGEKQKVNYMCMKTHLQKF